MNGWLKLYRKLTEWEWFTDANTLQLFIYLLCSANIQDTSFKGVKVRRGETIIGRKALAERLDKTEQEIRTALSHLILTNNITTKATNKFTIVTICNYDKYQVAEDVEQPTNQPTNPQQINQQTTTHKEIKNIRNKEYIKEDIDKSISKKSKAEREIDFRNKVAEVANGTYPQDMIDKFCDYWTESNESEKAKLRYEKEKVFDIMRRLNTWQNRSYGTNGNKHHTTDAEYKRQTAEAVRIASEFYAKGGSPF